MRQRHDSAALDDRSRSAAMRDLGDVRDLGEVRDLGQRRGADAARHREREECQLDIEALLLVGDVRAALGTLNARTRYRFTGLYRCQPPRLQSVALFDRENPTMRLGGDICLLSETYCSIVARDEEPFHTDDATDDPVLVAHPARCSVVSYLGVAVRDPAGAVWGTLCHYDLRPRLAPTTELALMEWAAAAIASHTVLAAGA